MPSFTPTMSFLKNEMPEWAWSPSPECQPIVVCLQEKLGSDARLGATHLGRRRLIKRSNSASWLLVNTWTQMLTYVCLRSKRKVRSYWWTPDDRLSFEALIPCVNAHHIGEQASLRRRFDDLVVASRRQAKLADLERATGELLPLERLRARWLE